MEEVTGAVGLGLFAADVVLALGRLLEGTASTADRKTLKVGYELLESLTASADIPPQASVGPHQLGSGGTALDVLEAVETEAAEVDVIEFLRPLADALQESLVGDVNQHKAEIVTLRRVFAAIGDAEVSRVSRLSNPRTPNSPEWPTSTAISAF